MHVEHDEHDIESDSGNNVIFIALLYFSWSSF
jgi:hypothetical protein